MRVFVGPHLESSKEPTDVGIGFPNPNACIHCIVSYGLVRGHINGSNFFFAEPETNRRSNTNFKLVGYTVLHEVVYRILSVVDLRPCLELDVFARLFLVSAEFFVPFEKKARGRVSWKLKRAVYFVMLAVLQRCFRM